MNDVHLSNTSSPEKTNDANMAVKYERKITQLCPASFNLIDTVLKHAAAYFVCAASKLTVTLSLPDILPGRSAALEWKRLKKEKNGTIRNAAPGICFCSCRLEKVNGVRRLWCDWQLEDFHDLLVF